MRSLTPKLVTAVLLGVGVAIALPVLAEGHGGHEGYGHRGCAHPFHAGMRHGFGYSEGRIEWMAKHLDLTKEQLASLRTIVDKHRPQLRRDFDQMSDSRSRIKSFLKEGKVDEAKLRAAADNQGKAIADLIVLRITMKEQIDKLLTDEQRKKMHHMKSHHMHSSMGGDWGDHAY